MKNKKLNRGFGLIEVITVVGVLGISASLSVMMVGNVSQNARTEKLFSDTKTINRAVMVYLASGGSVDSSDTADTVLAKLRTRASSVSSKRIPGLSGGFLDPQIAPKTQTASEAASNSARVYWDSTSNTFRVAYTGSVVGIKEFYLDDNLAEVDGGTEDRASPLLYAGTETGNWIWEYADVPLPSGPSGPAEVVLTPDTPSTTPATLEPVIPPSPAVPGAPLLAPNFSIPGGAYPIENFDLNVKVYDLNPSGIADIFYSVNYGGWQAYSGSFISNSPNDSIRAQAIARTTDYSSSTVTEVTYYATGGILAPPIINASLDSFGLFSNKPITVDLINTNEPGISEIRYRVNGGPWMPYTSGFSLQRNNYPTGVNIEAQAFSPAGSQYYSASSVSARLLSTESLNLVGDTEGSFHDPTGPSGMVSNLAPGDSDSHFEWGKDTYPFNPTFEAGLSKSTLDFTGNSFGNIAGGERFQIGNLDYYNGTILGGSGADSIAFSLGLNLNVNGNIFNPYFDFDFDLINVLNVNDPNNPWLDADYVLLDDPISSRTLVIDDFEFEFRIEFGDSSTDGFSSFNEFHVLEEKTASVNVYGTFIEIGPVATLDPLAPGAGYEVIDASNAITVDPLFQKIEYVDIEEAVADLLDQVKYEKGVAKGFKDDADDANNLTQKAANDAIKKGKEALSKNDAADARGKADESMQYATIATSEASRARQAAIDSAAAASAAQAAANEANILAQSDPGAEKKANEALDEAIKANEEAVKAEEFAVAAEAAAATARDYAAQADAWATSLGG